jgi:septation ring formation regulator EzrA
MKEQAESIRNLRDIATQTPAVTRLIDMISQQQTQNSKQHTQVISELSKLTGKISDLAGQFGELAKALNKSNKKGP